MYRPIQTHAPASPPVSLVEAKAHLRVQDRDEDDLITALVAVATAHLDGWSGVLGRAIVSQTWRQDFDDFWRCLRLPLAPAISITSVKYQDAGDAKLTVNRSNYELLSDDIGPYVRFIDSFAAPSVYGQGSSVSVTYVAGYATVPEPLKQAILLLAAHLYEHRETVVVGYGTSSLLPFAVESLVRPFKRYRF